MSKILIGFILFLATDLVCGQSLLDQYINHPKSEIDVEVTLVTEDVIFVSQKKPLIIKSPDKREVFKVYVFTKIWDDAKYKIFVGLPDDLFKPNLVTMTPGQVEIDRIQLLGNFEKDRPDFSVKEEAKISNDQEIVLTAFITRWKLDSNGEKVIGSEINENKTTRYRVTDSGKFEKLLN